ncbi:hypothetical protein [Chryseobacterium caseinilyticum]|uniref:Uncharacterized protein n=1 Tax=Chryseobacterium caseinilyticum TaxID=2771428 RepID=A0ABR8Z741_9FLAO|nr:hypothetical protein [Chryseobacterium caseinilyticum]MBD8081110.1 hypothetical protein [Chryseobacterium caseinilyticum]
MQNEQQFIEAAAQAYAIKTAEKEHRGTESIKEDFIAGVVFWGNRTVELLKSLTPGIQELAAERQKQIDKHGFTAEHHVNHPEWYENKQLIVAAASLLLQDLTPEQASGDFPENWDEKWFADLLSRSEAERVIIAGALLAAELDRKNELDPFYLIR